jgi:hypothetical protein
LLVTSISLFYCLVIRTGSYHKLFACCGRGNLCTLKENCSWQGINQFPELQTFLFNNIHLSPFSTLLLLVLWYLTLTVPTSFHCNTTWSFLCDLDNPVCAFVYNRLVALCLKGICPHNILSLVALNFIGYFCMPLKRDMNIVSLRCFFYTIENRIIA